MRMSIVITPRSIPVPGRYVLLICGPDGCRLASSDMSLSREAWRWQRRSSAISSFYPASPTPCSVVGSIPRCRCSNISCANCGSTGLHRHPTLDLASGALARTAVRVIWRQPMRVSRYRAFNRRRLRRHDFAEGELISVQTEAQRFRSMNETNRPAASSAASSMLRPVRRRLAPRRGQARSPNGPAKKITVLRQLKTGPCA